MEVIHETKYLIFAEEVLSGRKTKTIHVNNRSSGNEIATIEWYGAWRQYCFMPTMEFDTVWNNTCLSDIILVINKLMKEREVNNSQKK